MNKEDVDDDVVQTLEPAPRRIEVVSVRGATEKPIQDALPRRSAFIASLGDHLDKEEVLDLVDRLSTQLPSTCSVMILLEGGLVEVWTPVAQISLDVKNVIIKIFEEFRLEKQLKELKRDFFLYVTG